MTSSHVHLVLAPSADLGLFAATVTDVFPLSNVLDALTDPTAPVAHSHLLAGAFSEIDPLASMYSAFAEQIVVPGSLSA